MKFDDLVTDQVLIRRAGQAAEERGRDVELVDLGGWDSGEGQRQ